MARMLPSQSTAWTAMRAAIATATRTSPIRAVDRAEFEADIAQNCESHTTIEAHNPGHLMAKDNPIARLYGLPRGARRGAPVASMAADPVGTCQGCHQTYADPVVQETHEQIVANFSAEQTCQTCHSDVALTEDALCKTCHNLLDGEAVLPSGETLPLHVDPQMIIDSVHGDREIRACPIRRCSVQIAIGRFRNRASRTTR